MSLKLILLAVFGIAMAHLEGVVVVYLRKALGILDTESNNEAVKTFPKRYLQIEMTREAATIIISARRLRRFPRCSRCLPIFEERWFSCRARPVRGRTCSFVVGWITGLRRLCLASHVRIPKAIRRMVVRFRSRI